MNTISTNATVVSKINGCVLQVVLNRPKKRNAFNPDLIDALTRVFARDAQADGLRLIHLSGAGLAFCSGADLEWMQASRGLSDQDNYFDIDRLFLMYEAMQNCPVPILTQVHGPVYGGGIGLSCVSDIVIADEDSAFSLSETKRGLIPAVMMPFIIEKIGKSRTRELMITGRQFSAVQAMEYGLVHFISNSENKRELTENLIEEIISSAPGAILEGRKLIQETRDLPFEAVRHELVSSLARKRAGQEAQEGLEAFLQKRSPSWSGASWSINLDQAKN